LIVQELLSVTDIDFVTRAPDGKELEELTKKEIHKCLRGRIAAEQIKLEIGVKDNAPENALDDAKSEQLTGDTFSVMKSSKPIMPQQRQQQQRPQQQGHPQQQRSQQQTNTQAPQQQQRPPQPISQQQHPLPPRPPVQQAVKKQATAHELESFNDMIEDLIGTRAAFMLDDKLTILGKIPVSELISTIKSLNGGIYAAVLDDVIDKDLLMAAERANIQFLVGMDAKIKSDRLTILTTDDL
jgi:DNA primase